LGIDLIVIAQVGQRGLPRILVGSVTERVIEYAPCPVLVVK
jgi:nucleotide-binding universal stress UspA family protein